MLIRIIPLLLAAMLLGAHFLRNGNLVLMAFCLSVSLLPAMMMLVKKPSAAEKQLQAQASMTRLANFTIHHRKGLLIGNSILVLLLILVLLCASWYATYQRLEGRSSAVVTERTVEVLAGPGQNNATLATVHEGLDVEVWGEREEWIQVRLPNGVSGWVPRTAVEVV